ncbi:hypothetical protein L2734_02280 [Parashewanella spongiae]|uniref:opioid growth factor receptor-related protein n=1 Tax=Parashewanella spongiae TaxID=342950 RepID=UPI001059D582|nr:opioid growth factor receptor-related protein [Parashewanella spongiae]MCL1077011.1 hypothetical protein [Parashewanella spongiae]
MNFSSGLTIPVTHSGCFSRATTLTGFELNNLYYEQDDHQLNQLTSLKERIKNWFRGVDKADAAIAFRRLVHSTTAEEADAHFLKLQSCLGTQETDIILCFSHLNNKHYELKLDNSVGHLQITKYLKKSTPRNYQSTGQSTPIHNHHTISTSAVGSSNFRPQQSPWFRFMNGSGRLSGHSISEVLKFDDNKLENCHNFIQMIFPTQTTSTVVSSAPLLSSADVLNVHYTPKTQHNIQRCIDVMLKFYGLERSGDQVKQMPNASSISLTKWKSLTFTHNHKRISRMLTFLILCGYRDFASNLFGFFIQNRQHISRGVMKHWHTLLENQSLIGRQFRLNFQ